MPNSFYALVLAGGSGTRFWPLSRKTAPKQLLRLFGETTLLEDTLERLSGFVPPKNILVLTNEEQLDSVRKVLQGHPQENIIAEPAKRDTAAAIALGVGLIASRDPSATMVILPADHRISDHKAFKNDLRAAAEAAEKTGDLVTIGIEPTWACPGFGYIERGKKMDKTAPGHFEVLRFREKPNPDLAETFLRSGNFYWNGGIFVWTVQAILTAFNRYAPDFAEFVAEIRNSKDLEGTLKKKFAKLRKISVDYAIMEKAGRVLVKPASFDWDDVGSWISLAKYLKKIPSENVANCSVSITGGSENIVFSEDNLHIALLGVSDLIVVQSKDAILVCSRHEVEKVKQLVDQLPESLQ